MKENLRFVSKLLSDFDNFIGARSAYFLMRVDGVFKIVLEWHFEIWKKEHEYLHKEGKDKLEKWSNYSEISRILDSIFQQIEVRILKERGGSFSFFKSLKEHAEKYKTISVSSQHHYVSSLFTIFYRVFFQNIKESPERHDIWNHYFPKEWKITKSNLENGENIISGISLQNFLEWSQERFWQSREELDQDLNDVSSNIFPEVNPILWAAILIFIFLPSYEDRIRSIVERPWTFGYMGRVRVLRDEKKDKEENSEDAKTFELAYFLFEKEFSKENLARYILSLEKLSYDKDSKEESHRSRLLFIFRGMLDFIKDKKP